MRARVDQATGIKPHMVGMLVALLSLYSNEAFARRPTAPLRIITTISYPSGRARNTTVQGISNDGGLTGYFSSLVLTYGFVRTVDGKFRPPISYPPFEEVLPGGINTSGIVSGYSLDTITGLHGFLYQNGVYTPYDVPGSVNTLVTGINDQGSFVGLYVPAGPYITTEWRSKLRERCERLRVAHPKWEDESEENYLSQLEQIALDEEPGLRKEIESKIRLAGFVTGHPQNKTVKENVAPKID